jgi:hypothetical protein
MLQNSDLVGKEKIEFFEIIQKWLILKVEMGLKQKSCPEESELKPSFTLTI